MSVPWYCALLRSFSINVKNVLIILEIFWKEKVQLLDSVKQQLIQSEVELRAADDEMSAEKLKLVEAKNTQMDISKQIEQATKNYENLANQLESFNNELDALRKQEQNNFKLLKEYEALAEAKRIKQESRISTASQVIFITWLC